MHGEERGSVDRRRNLFGGPLAEADRERLRAEALQMDQAPYSMDAARRRVVLAAVLERCVQWSWKALAAHVRTNHVHIVVDAEVKPERIMNDLKSYASRCLNLAGFDQPSRQRWARHGSTRYLWEHEELSKAIRYVVSQQGESMAVFEG